MRASRAPEGRGATKRVLFFSVIAIAIIVGVVLTVFSMGSDSLSAKDDPAAGLQGPAATSASGVGEPLVSKPTPTPRPTATPLPAATAVPVATPTPTTAPEPVQPGDPTPAPQPTVAPTAQPESATLPRVFPEAEFGELIEEGLLSLRLTGGELMNTWYSFQVDTNTLDITLFFAQYDDELESIVNTVKVDHYARGTALDNATVTLYYPDGSSRILFFDGTEGSIALEQQYRLPIGQSMFSSSLRRALVYYGLQLRDDSGEIEVELHLDLGGLSQSEGLEFKRLVPGTVDEVLLELQGLVEQIEDNRDSS